VARRMSILGLLLIALTIVSLVNSYATTPLQISSQQREPAKAAANPGHPPYQRHDTWYEFMLKQINPNEVDYGRWLERERQAFIETRLKNPYFLYGLGTTIGLLLMAVVCVKLRMDHRLAMWIMAEMMADIYNQDAYSRRIAQEAIEKYNTHIERCNRVIEAVEHGEPVPGKGSEIEQLRGELACVASERDTATRERDLAREELRKKSEVLAEMSMRLEASTRKSGATGGPKPVSDLRGADAKLVTHINNLQEQLYAERNNNRRLKGG
jgi:hypothetical protein